MGGPPHIRFCAGGLAEYSSNFAAKSSASFAAKCKPVRPSHTISVVSPNLDAIAGAPFAN
jgi:hypothetical protein